MSDQSPATLTKEEQERIQELREHIETLLSFSTAAISNNLYAIEQMTGQKLHYCVFLFNPENENNKHRCVATDVDQAVLADLFKEQVERLEQQKDLIRDIKRINHVGSQAVH